jgi:hypothetical protein
MRTRNWNMSPESDVDQDDGLAESGDNLRKDYRRGRSTRTQKRRTLRRGGSQPPLGIAGRRNRRFSW